MAYYWDYTGVSTSSASTADWWSGGATVAYSTATSTSTTSSTTGNYYTGFYYYVAIQRFLIEAPEHWDDAITASFVRLINDETNTGFTVELVIKGEVAITDPSIQKRTMADFLPLLRRHAQGSDRGRIDAFFETFAAPSSPPEPVSAE